MKNLVNLYYHGDEVHDYYDESGAKKRSRGHIHAIVIPEVDGQLCGKKFSSKDSMKSLNLAVDSMVWVEYGLRFLTPEKKHKGDFKTVEDLKVQSIAELEKLIESKRQEIERLEEEILDRAEFKVYEQRKRELEQKVRVRTR